MEVNLVKGKFVLRKPTAGIRNDAMIKSETENGIKRTLFLTEMLPKCIMTHPFGTVPVRDALNALEFEEYDKLIEALKKLMEGNITKGDVEKESNKP